MSNAADYGFLPSNNGDQNAAALQMAVNEKGTIYIDKPGIYDISETILLRDDTSLVFGAECIYAVLNLKTAHSTLLMCL